MSEQVITSMAAELGVSINAVRTIVRQEPWQISWYLARQSQKNWLDDQMAKASAAVAAWPKEKREALQCAAGLS